MQVFAELARKLMNEEFRKRLLAIQNASTMIQYISHELAF